MVIHVYSASAQDTAAPDRRTTPYDSLQKALEAIYDTDQEIRKELARLMRENSPELNKLIFKCTRLILPTR